MKLLLLALIFGLLALTPGQAQDKPKPIYDEATTGNGFVRRCSAFQPYTEGKTKVAEGEVYFCSGYIDGLREGMAKMQIALGRQLYCIPNEAENGQIMHILFKYIRDHPEAAHQSTSTLLFKSLREAYPCRSRRK